MLAYGGWIGLALAHALKPMVDFRNIAVHDDQTLQLPITVAIIVDHLDDLLELSQTILQRDYQEPGKQPGVIRP